MEMTSEDIVTKILINREIIRWQDAPEVFDEIPKYNYSSSYDLKSYLASQPIEQKPKETSRFDERYLFVK